MVREFAVALLSGIEPTTPYLHIHPQILCSLLYYAYTDIKSRQQFFLIFLTHLFTRNNIHPSELHTIFKGKNDESFLLLNSSSSV